MFDVLLTKKVDENITTGNHIYIECYASAGFRVRISKFLARIRILVCFAGR
jgi:hypothetical protein